MMISIRNLAVSAVIACASAAAGASIYTIDMDLTGAQEGTPPGPNSSLARGTGQMIYDDVSNLFDMSLTVTGITRAQLREGSGPNTTSIHIHRAPAGVNGAIVIDLGWYGEQQHPGATASGWQVLGNGDLLLTLDDVPLFQAQQGLLNVTGANGCGLGLPCTLDVLESSLFNKLLYVNVHTQRFPGGEIRGQIPEPGTLALLGLGLAGIAAWRRRIA